MTTTAAPQTTAHCARCGRQLRDAVSVARRLGPTCWKRAQEAAKAAAQSEPAARVDAAVEAIEDGAVVHQTRDLWQVVSSTGTEVYTVDAATGSCTCKAGEHGRACWHRVAVSLLGVPVAPVPPVVLAQPADPFANIPADPAPMAA